MMTFISFDARIRDDRLVGFFCPNPPAPGTNCSFTVTITQGGTPSQPSNLLALFAFAAIVPPITQRITFAVPLTVPLGIVHITILISTIGSPDAPVSLTIKDTHGKRSKKRKKQ